MECFFASTFVEGRSGQREKLSSHAVSTEASLTQGTQSCPHCRHTGRASAWPHGWLEVSLDVQYDLGRDITLHLRHSLRRDEG